MVSKATLVARSAKNIQMHNGMLGTGLNGDIFCCRYISKISYCFEAFSLDYVGYPSKF